MKKATWQPPPSPAAAAASTTTITAPNDVRYDKCNVTTVRAGQKKKRVNIISRRRTRQPSVLGNASLHTEGQNATTTPPPRVTQEPVDEYYVLK